MIKTTRAQRIAIYAVWLRNKTKSYKAFRKTARLGPDCIMVPFAGMWLGIETDGYTHS